MRVVSLLPAATEIVAALGALPRLVGVSHECDYPPEARALPRVTRTRLDASLPSAEIDRAMAAARRTGTPPVEVDVKLIAHLRPDVILGQSLCDVCAVGEGGLAQLVTALNPTPWVVTLHAHTLDGVLADIHKVGAAVNLEDEADELVAGLRYRLRRVRQAHAPRPPGSPLGRPSGSPSGRPTPPSVLVLEWLDPPYVAGHWVPELVDIAGGRDVAGRPGERSTARSWRELSALAPDLVVVALCGFDVARAQQELAAVTDRDARVLLGRRVGLLDGNAYTSRPGPRLVDAAEILARLIAG